MRMKTEREKDRIKERRKKGARKYGQSKLKEARKGVLRLGSCNFSCDCRNAVIGIFESGKDGCLYWRAWNERYDLFMDWIFYGFTRV